MVGGVRASDLTRRGCMESTGAGKQRASEIAASVRNPQSKTAKAGQATNEAKKMIARSLNPP